ncbi:hypothetical protein C8J57DRAFT_1439242 [Mycena rebaudengoi]|nr:hypothetical protein C8J57DRAFT_1439242 [Mycena rebaudengoi]
MGYRKISRDVKIAALNLYEAGQMELPDILKCCGFSERTFYCILYLWRTTGDVVKHNPKNTVPAAAAPTQPDWFLNELLRLLETNRFISVHYTTIHRELERAGMSSKQLTVIAQERNEPSRNNFVEYLGFLDETSKNDKTPSRHRGHAKKGRLLTIDGIMASMVVEGSLHRDEYLHFLEHQVVHFYFLVIPELEIIVLISFLCALRSQAP